LIAAVPRIGSMTGEAAPLPFAIVDPTSGKQANLPERADTVVRESKPVIDVRNLTTRFDIASGIFSRVHSRIHAVENVSFSIQPGEPLSLVGESGCGKSTTGRSIMQLIPISGGHIRIEDQDLAEFGRKERFLLRRNVQMIFH